MSYVFHINENYHIMQIWGAQPFFEKKLFFIQKNWYFWKIGPEKADEIKKTAVTRHKFIFERANVKYKSEQNVY